MNHKVYWENGQKKDEIDISGVVIVNNIDTKRLHNGKFDGSATWIDYSYPATTARQGVLSKPDFDYDSVGLLFPQNTTSEQIYITNVFNHNWKEQSTIYPHVHIRQNQNKQAVFGMDYKWYNGLETEPGTWTRYTMSTYAGSYSSGTFSNVVTNATGIDGTGKYIGSIMQIKLFRNDNVYVGDCLVDQFDIHVQIDSTGSETEFTK